MVVDTSAIVTTLVTVDFGNWCLSEIGRAAYTICGSRFAVGAGLGLANCDPLSIGLVDVASDFQVKVSLGRCRRVGLALSVGVLLALEDNWVSRRLPGLQTARCIADDFEVAGEGRANRRWALLGVDLIIPSEIARIP